MKKLFNATCTRCGEFKPRCAKVHVLLVLDNEDEVYEIHTLCADCRKECRGRFKLAEEHR